MSWMEPPSFDRETFEEVFDINLSEAEERLYESLKENLRQRQARMAITRSQFNKLTRGGFSNALAFTTTGRSTSIANHRIESAGQLRERRLLMSPRFEPDMQKARASTRIFDQGEYELKIGEPQPLLYERDDDDGGTTVVAGVRYPLEMVGRITADGNIEEEGDWGEAGEDVTPARFYVHTDAAWPMAKRFVMAAMGFSLEEEDEFDEVFVEEHSFAIDGDVDSEEPAELGSGWTEAEGQRVWMTLGQDVYKGRQQQTHENPMPVGSD